MNAPSRDRFLTFAFAAADLLVETGTDAKITWAAGAFTSRFGRVADCFIGQPVDELIAPADRPALAHALAMAALHGRLAPLSVRLNDARETRCALGALAVPDHAGRLCLTLASLPVDAAPPPSVTASRTELASQAEASLRAGQSRSLGLLDVAGWSTAHAALSSAERNALRADITQALVELGGPGVLVGEMGQGRYGVLAGTHLDLTALTNALQGVIQASPMGRNLGAQDARVSGQTIGLAMPGLTPGQASRALRFALSRFADGGLVAVTAAGFAQGLAGFIADAGGQAADLRARIAAHRFRLVYQPVVRLADRVPHHYEALLRPLPNPDGPNLSTQDFVTFAEAIGLSEELDLAVATDALATLHETKAVRVAVNVSGLSMQSAAFRDRLLALIPTDTRLLVELRACQGIAESG